MPRTVARAVATLVLLGCLPQLVDNSARSLVHPRYAAVFTLAPYFESMDIRGLPLSSGWGFERDQRAQTHSYEAAVGTITGSACRRVAIANWIRVEYPLWAGLRRADWAGTMNDIGVANESSRYQVPDFFPCALIRQQQPGYVSADEGMAAFQFGQLALSFAPEALGTAPSPPGFLGAGGVAIYPGSGWALGSDGPSGLVDGATVFVCSPVSGTVDLEFELGPSAGAGSVTSPLASRVITKAGNVTLRLQLPAGRSEIPVVVKGGRAKKLDVRQVRAAPGAAKGPP
jgi:hypothetical protein